MKKTRSCLRAPSRPPQATTPVIKKTLAPEWGASFELKMPPAAARPTLQFDLFDKDTIGSDKLGSVRATLVAADDAGGWHDAWLPLEGGPKVQGEVHVRYQVGNRNQQ